MDESGKEYTSDTSSSEEDIADFSQDVMPGLSGYQREPQYDSSEIGSDSSSAVESESDDNNVEEEAGYPRGADCRIGNTNWCLCQKCDHSLLIGVKEHVCCMELRRNKAKAVVSGTTFIYIHYKT
jgi:hypothetical protein